MDTDSFILHTETEDIGVDIAKDVEAEFETSNYKLDKPVTRGKNKEVTVLIKGKLNGKIMTEFAVLRAKTYSYLVDDVDKKIKEKDPKNVS